MQVKTQFMASFAGMLMILMVIVFASRPPTVGLQMKIARETDQCSNGHMLVVHARANGEVTLNGDAMTLHALEDTLEEFFRTKAQRLVFLSADLELPFRDVAEVLDTLTRQADHVVIVTPALERVPPNCLAIRFPPFMDINYVSPPPHMKEVPWWRFWR